jgi:hypothetical protein
VVAREIRQFSVPVRPCWIMPKGKARKGFGTESVQLWTDSSDLLSPRNLTQSS